MKKLLLLSALFILSSVSYSQSELYKKNIRLAQDNFSKKDYRKTILFSIKSLNEKPNDFLALYFLQLSHNHLDEFDTSLEYGNQIVKLHSNQKKSRINRFLSYSYFVQGLNFYFLDNIKSACSFFHFAILTEPNDPLMTNKQIQLMEELCND